MAGLDNLNSSPMRRMSSQLRSLNTAPAATNTAIGRAGMEVYDGGVIDITNGGLNVTGTATISGTLTGSGTFTWSGPFNQSGVSTFTGNVNLNGPTGINGALTVAGNTTVTGTFNVNGAMKTTSTLSVEGVTTLKNDLNVTTGKINAGGMTIDPGLFGGSIGFDAGGYLSGTTSGPQITGPTGNSFLYTRDALAGIQAADIQLSGATEVLGSLRVTSPGAETGVTANVYMDSAGNLRKIV